MKQWLRKQRLLVDKTAETAFSILPSSPYLKMKWSYHNLSRSRKELDEIRRLRATNGRFEICFKPFDVHKTIFVHVPKCAGNSVNVALFGTVAGGHTTLSGYLDVFEPECIASYFKFAIARNPWDRLVSGYHYLEKGGNIKNDFHRNWFSTELGQFKDFDEFVKGWLNKHNIWKLDHFRPQYHYILETHGKIHLDFVGFLENLDEDFLHLKRRIGIDCELQHRNKSKHEDYMAYYSEEAKKIVAEVYDTDIELLGYNFDNSNLPAQLAQRSSGSFCKGTPPPLPRSASRYL